MREKSDKQISIVVITKNEEKEIESFIKSAKQISDDIIVVDAESRDRTVSLAKSLGAKTFVKPWLGYGPNKNYGNKMARYDWILSLDADERISAEMANSIIHLQLIKTQIYSFKLTDHVGNRAVKYTELRAKWKKRLFNKLEVKWNDKLVHEQLSLENVTKTVKCEGRILHYSYNSISDLREKYKQYAFLGAEGMSTNNKTISIFKKYINPKWRFFRSYVIYLGFLEGKLGWDISKALHDMLQIKYESIEKFKRN